MTQYIDKSAVQVEIERRIKERDLQMKRGIWVSSSYVYEDLLGFLDTLEVKNIDLVLKFIKARRNELVDLMHRVPYASNYHVWSSNVDLLDEIEKVIES